MNIKKITKISESKPQFLWLVACRDFSTCLTLPPSCDRVGGPLGYAGEMCEASFYSAVKTHHSPTSTLAPFHERD